MYVISQRQVLLHVSDDEATHIRTFLNNTCLSQIPSNHQQHFLKHSAISSPMAGHY